MKPIEIEKVLNLNCRMGMHDKCPGKSPATKSDRVMFICICTCHKTGK